MAYRFNPFSGTLDLVGEGTIESGLQPGDELTELGSGDAAQGQVPAADGEGGITWEDPQSGGVVQRSTASVTLTALAGGATGTGTITLPRACTILSIETNRAGWVRLYDSAAASAADASRLRTADPGPDDGVIAEVITTGAATAVPSNKPIAANAETTPTTSYPVRVTNDGATGDFTVTITHIQIQP